MFYHILVLRQFLHQVLVLRRMFYQVLVLGEMFYEVLVFRQFFCFKTYVLPSFGFETGRIARNQDSSSDNTSSDVAPPAYVKYIYYII